MQCKVLGAGICPVVLTQGVSLEGEEQAPTERKPATTFVKSEGTKLQEQKQVSPPCHDSNVNLKCSDVGAELKSVVSLPGVEKRGRGCDGSRIRPPFAA